MISALVQGSLFRAPEQRTAKTGRQFVSVTIRVKDGDGSQFVRIVAFSDDAQTELMRMQDGDAVSVQGQLKVEVYEKDGEHRVSLSLVANHVLALRQPARERISKPSAPDDRSRQERLAGTWSAGSGDPNDNIGF